RSTLLAIAHGCGEAGRSRAAEASDDLHPMWRPALHGARGAIRGLTAHTASVGPRGVRVQFRDASIVRARVPAPDKLPLKSPGARQVPSKVERMRAAAALYPVCWLYNHVPGAEFKSAFSLAMTMITTVVQTPVRRSCMSLHRAMRRTSHSASSEAQPTSS